MNIGNRQQVLRRFHQREDDLYLFSHPPSEKHTLAGRFLHNPLVVIANQQHPLAQQKGIDFSALLQERFILREPGSATRKLFNSYLQTQGFSPKRSLQMASNEAIKEAVATGMGVAVLSQHVVGHHPNLCVLDVSGFPLQSHWHVIAHAQHQLPHAALGFLRFCQQHLDELLPQELVENEIEHMLQQLQQLQH